MKIHEGGFWQQKCRKFTWGSVFFTFIVRGFLRHFQGLQLISHLPDMIFWVFEFKNFLKWLISTMFPRMDFHNFLDNSCLCCIKVVYQVRKNSISGIGIYWDFSIVDPTKSSWFLSPILSQFFFFKTVFWDQILFGWIFFKFYFRDIVYICHLSPYLCIKTWKSLIFRAKLQLSWLLGKNICHFFWLQRVRFDRWLLIEFLKQKKIKSVLYYWGLVFCISIQKLWFFQTCKNSKCPRAKPLCPRRGAVWPPGEGGLYDSPYRPEKGASMAPQGGEGGAVLAHFVDCMVYVRLPSRGWPDNTSHIEGDVERASIPSQKWNWAKLLKVIS